MASRILRDETSKEGQAIWKDVKLAASRAPEWIKERANSSSSTPPKEATRSTGGGREDREPRRER